ncbi:GNAT family N-acetyltransferase [Thalassotalea mangrovi]|uniref:GNAT family N-acetyltransferase n=1 Tax=Thalassotalea mangrovi TaxID=2572245 RepID=A0A4U1B814_9GAMM|nr:GNAT family N-acetyltransferase [Thalassotalea mangrovi]TKB46636.1 GNAT family N-acetyltransferase [Thalassotalea mangrovi]
MVKQSHLSFFLDFSWLNLWWHTYARPGDRLYIVLLYKHDNLIAIAPFYIQHQTLRMLGTGEAESEEVASEYLDIICAPEHFQSVASNLCDILMDCLFTNHHRVHPYCQQPMTAVTHITLNNYLAHSCLAHFVRKINRYFFISTSTVGTSYRCRLPSEREQFWQQLQPSFRKKMFRHRNQWLQQMQGEFKSYRYLSSLEEGIQHLQDLHQKRWQRLEKPGVFKADKFRLFHQKFMHQALLHNRLELWVLFARGQAISAIYAITYNETCYFYQSGLDTEFRPNLSPGFLSHFLLIEECIKRQFKYYDFMKGASGRSYKQQFADNTRELFESRLAVKKASNLGFAMNNKLKQARDFLLWKNQ